MILVYSMKSSRKIVHLTHCKIIQRIAKENRCVFDSFEDAVEHGYRLCNCCPSLAQKYHKEKKADDLYCGENQLQMKLRNGVIHIISRHDIWRIIACGHNKRILLYHKNTEKRMHSRKYPQTVAGFHVQAVRSTTILEYLQYIKKHDDYRDVQPYTEAMMKAFICKRNKATNEMRKQMERVASIARVDALIEEIAVMNGYRNNTNMVI